MPDERPDSDITLGEVNRNLNQFRSDVKDDLKEIKTGFVSKDQHDSLVGRVAELENSQKSKITNSIAIVAIVVSAGLSIWQAVHP